MIRYIPGFAPVADGAPKVSEKQASTPSVSVEQARALAVARQTEVLGYSRKPEAPSPLKTNLRTDGPTLEVWLKSGYDAANYPPEGYAELPSRALDFYKAIQSGLQQMHGGEVAPQGDGVHTPHSVTDKPHTQE